MRLKQINNTVSFLNRSWTQTFQLEFYTGFLLNFFFFLDQKLENVLAIVLLVKLYKKTEFRQNVENKTTGSSQSYKLSLSKGDYNNVYQQ